MQCLLRLNCNACLRNLLFLMISYVVSYSAFQTETVMQWHIHGRILDTIILHVTHTSRNCKMTTLWLSMSPMWTLCLPMPNGPCDYTVRIIEGACFILALGMFAKRIIDSLQVFLCLLILPILRISRINVSHTSAHSASCITRVLTPISSQSWP